MQDNLTWKEQRKLIEKKQPELLKTAESCDHFLDGFCCESLAAGRTWDCFFIRDYKKGEVVQCTRYKELEK